MAAPRECTARAHRAVALLNKQVDRTALPSSPSSVPHRRASSAEGQAASMLRFRLNAAHCSSASAVVLEQYSRKSEDPTSDMLSR